MMKKSVFILSMAFMALLSCTSKSDTVDCSTVVGATYSSNGGKMASILTNKCGGAPCHSAGGSGSSHWFLGTYANLEGHFKNEAFETIEANTMPPAGSPKLTSDELNLFECWSKNGYPQ